MRAEGRCVGAAFGSQLVSSHAPVGLPGLEVWDINKEGSRLAWVTRPTLTLDPSTAVLDVQGLNPSNRQLLQQKGAAFEQGLLDTGTALNEMLPHSAC